MHLHSTLEDDLFTLDVEHMDDDVMHYDAFMMIGACLPLGHHFEDELGSFDDVTSPLMSRCHLSPCFAPFDDETWPLEALTPF
jgi:hypothetical protein